LKLLFWGLPRAKNQQVASLWFEADALATWLKFLINLIIQHNFARFVTNKYHHPAPFFFIFIRVLVALAFP